jgi:hypothetical protein
MARKDGPWRDGRRAWERLESWRERVAGNAGDSPQEALSALTDVGALRRLLDQAELEAVRSARGHRSSWAEIATRLGVTRQSAWERWRDLDESSPPAAAAGAPAQATPAEQVGPAADALGRQARDLARRAMRDALLAHTPESAAAADEPAGRRGPRGKKKWIVVPSVVGLPWMRAVALLSGRGFFTLPATLGDGLDTPVAEADAADMVVTAQAPEAGARLEPGATVTLWITRDGGGSAGDREPRRPVPSSPPARAMRPEPGSTGGPVTESVA